MARLSELVERCLIGEPQVVLLYDLKTVTRNKRHFAATGVGAFDPWTIP